MACDRRWIQSFLYFSTFLVFGMTIGMNGPVLMDILLVYFGFLNIISALARILFTQALTRFVGAIVAGVAADRFQCNYNKILAFCMGINALLQFAIPLSRELWCLIMLMAMSGLFAGVIDTISNVALIDVHGIKVAPYLQCLYFSYGLGAFMSPLIAEPFLSERKGKMFGASSMVQLDSDNFNHTSIVTHEAIDKSPFIDPAFWSKSPGHVEVAFWIVAALHVPIICGLVVVGFIDTEDEHGRKLRDLKARQKTTVNQFIGQEENLDESSNKSNERTIVLITMLTSIVVFIFDGLQGSFGGYIFAYARAINMTAAQGAVLTSLFWGFLAVGRLLSIPLAVYFLPSNMLKVSMAFAVVITALMMLFHRKCLAIWLGTCLFALSMGNIFPSSLSMIEQHFPVTGAIACAFVVSAAIGESIIPLIVGELFDRYGTIIFMGSALFLCTSAGVTFGVLQVFTTKWDKMRAMTKREDMESE